jgi:hypothetical protein
MSWRTPRTWLRSVLHAPTDEQSPAQLSSLRDMAIVDPLKAVESIVKEQMSLAQRLPTYLDDVREEMRGESGPGARALHNRTVAALKEIDLSRIS